MTISVFRGVYPLLLEKPNAFFSKQYLDDIYRSLFLCYAMLFSQVHQKINLTSWCTVYVNINCSMISLK